MKIFLFLSGVLLFFGIELKGQNLMKIEGTAQGSTYHISYYDKLERELKPEIKRILKDFDKSLSTYDSTSIISRLNNNKKDVVLDKYFITCFNKAKEVWKNTDGAFDPTVKPLVDAWGFGPGKKKKLSAEQIDSVLKFVGFDLVKIKGNKLIKKDPRVALDFNAFAQGYSVDVVAAFLEEKSIHSYIIEIGGELIAKGKKPNGELWTVGIERPDSNEVGTNPLTAIVRLDNKAIATSGNYRKFFVEDGVKYSHGIDPKTGKPTKNNVLSVSLLADDCISADAYATGVMVMGLNKAKAFLEKHKELQAYIIYSDEKGAYQVYQTEGTRQIIEDIKEE